MIYIGIYLLVGALLAIMGLKSKPLDELIDEASNGMPVTSSAAALAITFSVIVFCVLWLPMIVWRIITGEDDEI